MKDLSSSGQVAVFALILLPVLLGVLGILSRSGMALLRHDQALNHCDQKVLDALAIEAEGLHKLGTLNTPARLIIDFRRWVDQFIEMSAPFVVTLPELLALQRSLKSAQKVISMSQNYIKTNTRMHTAAVLHSRDMPPQFRGKMTQFYSPFVPKLFIKDEEGYENETGAPLQPAKDFKEAQSITGKITLFTEKFTWPWSSREVPMARLPNLLLKCKAHIILEKLEDSWKVKLVPAS